MSRTALLLARVILLLVGVLTLLFGSSAAFVGGRSDVSVLASTFGAGMGVLVLAAAWQVTSARPAPLLWLALCYLPVFFGVHVAAFGTWVPDLPLLVLTVVALALTAPHVFARAQVAA
jgi:hypothetical protein